MGKDVYIITSKRLAIGGFSKGLSSLSAEELATPLVNNLIEETKVDTSRIDELIVGNVLNAGTKQGLARQIVLKSKIDNKTCGHVISMVCGSGLKSINDAYTKIKAVEANLIIAGGSESMSNAPYLLTSAREGFKYGHKQAIDSILSEALVDAIHGVHMGVTAENIADKYHITREDQDIFALNSIDKAIMATKNGYFSNEILPIEVNHNRKTMIVDKDEHIKYDTSFEKLSKLRTVFKENGSVTAGNASGINDGAAFLMLGNESIVKEFSLKPQAIIKGISQQGIDPLYMGLGPIYAINDLLSKTGISLSEIDILELNEAFSAQAIAVLKQLALDHSLSYDTLLERTNLGGGAVALGHPVGASGARIVVTLINHLKRCNKRYGIASLCIGGGMGIAILIENIEV